MAEFFASLSGFGWVVVALAVFTALQLPTILRMVFYRFKNGHWIDKEAARRDMAKSADKSWSDGSD